MPYATGADGHCTEGSSQAIVVGLQSGTEVITHMTRLYVRIASLFVRDEEGQGLAEYALILALIAILAIIALIFLGGQVSKVLSTVGKSI